MKVAATTEADLDIGGIPTVVLCGGAGNRIADVTNGDVAKHLLDVDGRTLIEHALSPFLGSAGLLLATGNHGKQIQEFFSTKRDELGVAVDYSHEEQPAGVIPALVGAAAKLPKTAHFIVTHGDEVISGLDMQVMLEFHASKNSDLTVATTVRQPSVRDFLMWEDDQARVTRLSREPEDRDDNAAFGMGTFIFGAESVDQLHGFQSIHEFLAVMIRKHRLYNFRTATDFHNINTAGDLAAYQAYLKAATQ